MIYQSVVFASLAMSSVGAKSWSLTNAPTMTSVGGVAAVSAKESYAAVTDNTNGPIVEHTTDAYETEENLGPFGFINTAVAFNKNTDTGLLVYGGGVATFTPEGKFTKPAILGFAQDAHTFGTSSFGSAGSYFTADTMPPTAVDGVTVSRDNGVTWELYDSGLGSGYPARYAAFPSDDTWYISAGTWSSNYAAPKIHDMSKNDTITEHYLSSKISVNREGLTKFYSDSHVTSSTYNGAIAKTTDGGKTWEQVYDTHEFYFNQIDCISDSHCMAVGEGNGNAYVLATTNGGKTWKKVHSSSDGSTLMGCTMLSETEAWVSGGNMDLELQGLAGYFWHTVDGGESWELEKLKNALSMGMSFADGVGYSTATNEFQATVAIYN